MPCNGSAGMRGRARPASPSSAPKYEECVGGRYKPLAVYAGQGSRAGKRGKGGHGPQHGPARRGAYRVAFISTWNKRRGDLAILHGGRGGDMARRSCGRRPRPPEQRQFVGSLPCSARHGKRLRHAGIHAHGLANRRVDRHAEGRESERAPRLLSAHPYPFMPGRSTKP
jgi:hypothetical protein